MGLVIVLLFLPGGFSQLYYDGRDRILRWIAGRHGIHVPSLIADSRQDLDDQPSGAPAEPPALDPDAPAAPLVTVGDDR